MTLKVDPLKEELLKVVPPLMIVMILKVELLKKELLKETQLPKGLLKYNKYRNFLFQSAMLYETYFIGNLHVLLILCYNFHVYFFNSKHYHILIKLTLP